MWVKEGGEGESGGKRETGRRKKERKERRRRICRNERRKGKVKGWGVKGRREVDGEIEGRGVYGGGREKEAR